MSCLETALDVGLPFPLVLVDANMPEMDGFGLVEQMRRNPKLAGHHHDADIGEPGWRRSRPMPGTGSGPVPHQAD